MANYDEEGITQEELEELAEAYIKGDTEQVKVLFNRYLKELGSSVIV